jgi:hypothetical protein
MFINNFIILNYVRTNIKYQNSIIMYQKHNVNMLKNAPINDPDQEDAVHDLATQSAGREYQEERESLPCSFHRKHRISMYIIMFPLISSVPHRPHHGDDLGTFLVRETHTY